MILYLLAHALSGQANKIFDDNSTYQVRLLYQPLLCDTVGPIGKYFDLSHSGLGFVNEQTNQEHVVEFETDPTKPFVLADYFRPHVKFNEKSKMYDIEWFSFVIIQISNSIKKGECGWYKQIVVSSGVKGSILNQWVEKHTEWFLQKWGQTYQFLAFRYHDTDESYPGIIASHCHDFSWWGLQSLQNDFGVKFNGKVAPRLFGFFNINRNPEWFPKELDPKDPIDNKIIGDAYINYQIMLDKYSNNTQEQFKYIFSKQFFEDIAAQNKNTLVWYMNNRYYQFTTDQYPIAWFELEKLIVPSDK